MDGRHPGGSKLLAGLKGERARLAGVRPVLGERSRPHIAVCGVGADALRSRVEDLPGRQSVPWPVDERLGQPPPVQPVTGVLTARRLDLVSRPEGLVVQVGAQRTVHGHEGQGHRALGGHVGHRLGTVQEPSHGRPLFPAPELHHAPQPGHLQPGNGVHGP